MNRSFSLSAALAAFVLAGASGTAVAADDGCFLFVNESDVGYHVSFDDPLHRCPTGTCWQADLSPGQIREYCPGPLLYEIVLPIDGPTQDPFSIVIKDPERVISKDKLGGWLMNDSRPFHCKITKTRDATLIWDGGECGRVRLGRVRDW